MELTRGLVLQVTQTALLGNITKNMKAITISFTESSYTLRVYFESEPSEEELEILINITSEVCAELPEITTFKEEAIVADSSIQVSKLLMLDEWVYMEHYPLL
jgi:hypothetical protein